MLALRRISKRTIKRWLVISGMIWFYRCVPHNLFDAPYASLVTGQSGELLMATIADDGQWRFPAGDSIPYKFEQSLIEFEDHRFYGHLGVSISSLARATVQNIRNKRVVSGGSTITMQVIRISRQRTGRALSDKLLEMAMALRLEMRFSKKDILGMYAAHAPFGGNVVGLEAAAWRYFGHAASDLSWAESATLAVLPNAPGLMHPGRNRDLLRAKRNRLLKRLWEKGELNELEYKSALQEPLPDKPRELPQLTYHYLAHLQSTQGNQHFKTTIDETLQSHLNELAQRYGIYLGQSGIHNLGVVVMSVKDGAVKAYIGNLPGTPDAPFVDVIQAPRSTGSILKPFLYAGAMQEGLITPHMLLPDYPTRIHGYTPKNYEDAYDGMVRADEALSRSLNIPAVRLLSQYGVTRFKRDATELGISTLFRPASDYGLSLILGGGEATLWDLTGAYRKLALDAHPNHRNRMYDAAVSWSVLEAMTQVNRPGMNQYWSTFQGEKIAWKTGTSFGARDAWAVGVTPEFVVGVWVGNASGEGVAGMTGTSTAGPLLFDVFRYLPATTWFQKPVRNMKYVAVCTASGHRAGRHCEITQQQWLPRACLESDVCPYHQSQVDRSTGVRTYQFQLPVAAAHYYRLIHPEYQSATLEQKTRLSNRKSMSVIYPQPGVSIRIPVTFSGELGEVVFETVHHQRESEVFWFIDKHFITSTKDIHQINVQPEPGKHVLTVVDSDGYTIHRTFEVE